MPENAGNNLPENDVNNSSMPSFETNMPETNDIATNNQNEVPSSENGAVGYDPNARQKMQAQLNADTDRKMGETVARAADMYFTGGSVGKAVDAAEKVPIVGGMVADKKNELFDAVGKPIGKAIDTVDGIAGTGLRDGANTVNQAGGFDMANKAMSMGAGGGTGAATGGIAKGAPGSATPSSTGDIASGATKGLSSAPGNTKLEIPEGYEPEDISGGSTPPPPAPQDGGGDKKDAPGFIDKKKIILSILGPAMPFIVGFFLLIIVVAIVSPNAGATLDVTSGSADADLVSLRTTYTNEQIEIALAYVGDSRIIGLQNAINKANIRYVAEVGIGYNWFINDGQSLLEVYLETNVVKFVVFNFGINDLANIDRYINIYNSLINSYPDIKFYFMSVNPVDETLATSNGYTVTNTDIEEFNRKLREAFDENYIETYNPITNYFSTLDGIHYDDKTYQEIHNIVLEFIRSKNVTDNEFGEAVTPDYSEDLGDVTEFGTSASYPSMSPVRGKFGQFPYNDAPAGRNITIDPRWVSANIISINFPCSEISSSVQIHKLAKPNFDAAFTNICKLITTGINGMQLSVSDINLNGAYTPRKASSGGYSLHGYGLAIDLNVTLAIMVNGNRYTPYMSQGTSTYNEYKSFVNALGGNEADSKNVNYILWKYAFEPAGFKWGGDWSISSFDPMHYEIDWRA